jgi:hypothetical protein
LTKLHCDENQLTGLDVSKNPEMTMLVCSENKIIKGEKMTALVGSLPDRTGKRVGRLVANELNKTQEAIAEDKNWYKEEYCPPYD